MQFRHIAVGDRHDPHPGERHLLVKAGDTLLIAAQSIQRLSHHHVEASDSGVGQQRLEAGAGGGGAADRVVGVDLDNVQTLMGRMLPAEAHLVVDRVRRLRVAAEPCVDRGALTGHSYPSSAATVSVRSVNRLAARRSASPAVRRRSAARPSTCRAQAHDFLYLATFQGAELLP